MMPPVVPTPFSNACCALMACPISCVAMRHTDVVGVLPYEVTPTPYCASHSVPMYVLPT